MPNLFFTSFSSTETVVSQDDFLLLVGYCGWGEGQLQGELNNQDTWTMASVDPKQLLGQLRSEQAELRRRKPGAAAVGFDSAGGLPGMAWRHGTAMGFFRPFVRESMCI
eukprot:Skav201053  [mRNA]  locus=scaffold215:157844:158170:- [translate_table: standard]